MVLVDKIAEGVISWHLEEGNLKSIVGVGWMLGAD